jgi:hypothetical protein
VKQIPQTWRLRAGETSADRRADIAEMRGLIEKAGQMLEYPVQAEGANVIWQKLNGQPAWCFTLMASSLISRYVLTNPAVLPDAKGLSSRCVLVLPGGRARLLAYKLRRDPRLAEAARGWTFLKFRHLRQIVARSSLSGDEWESLINTDPLTEEAEQIQLF